MAITSLIFQTPDPANNNPESGWNDLPGLFEVVLTRYGPAVPGALEIRIIADDQDSAGDPGKRFYPYLNVRLVMPQDNRTQDIVLFIGRMDHAELKEESFGTPRHWWITCRDWLSVLADNMVGPGLWRSIDIDTFRGPISRDGVTPVTRNDKWDGAYVDRWNLSNSAPVYHFGEFRRYIIEDLALNIVQAQDPTIPVGPLPPDPVGLLGISQDFPPNSKPINYRLADLKQVTVLDAIRALLQSDPWCGPGCSPCPGDAGLVDGYNISQGAPGVSPYTACAGFGGEFQIAPYTLSNPDNHTGRVASYFRRGNFDSGAVYSYQANFSGPATSYIESYQFAHEGADIYSRVRPQGSGESAQNNEVSSITPGGGEGVVFPDMEVHWLPEAGQYRVRREPNSQDQASVGFAGYISGESETDFIHARSLNDRGYANLISGGSALISQRGGIHQGTIVVMGPPITPVIYTSSTVLTPGYACHVTIPQLGLNMEEFIIDGIKYTWPDDKTQLVLSRLSFIDIRQQLLNWQNLTSHANAGAGRGFQSKWQAVDGTGKSQWRHNVGVFGAKVTIEVGFWDGMRFDPSGNPVPTPNTVVKAPFTYFDAAQGQYIGYTIDQSDTSILTIFYSHWIAHSTNCLINNGWYLATDTAHTLIRATVNP